MSSNFVIKFSKFNWIFFVRILIKTIGYNASYKWQKELDCVTKRKTPTLVTLDELYKTIISKWPIIFIKKSENDLSAILRNATK